MAASQLRIFAFTAALAFAFPLPVIAGLSWEDSWSAQSPNGRYLLVMLQTNCELANSENQEGTELEKRYSQSGVYIRGETEDSLYWALPYQPPVYSAYLSDNGEHLLLAIPAGHTSSNVPPWAALHFFHKNGDPQHWLEYELTRGFLVKELLYIYLRRSWSEWTDTAYDPTANTFTVRTNRAEEYVFDMTNGRKRHTHSDWDFGSAIFLVCAPALIYGTRRIASSRSQSNGGSRFWQMSLAEVLVFITVGAVLLALARFSAVLSIVVLLGGLGGGAIAQMIARGRLSWWMGGLTAVYGTFVDLVVFSTFGELLLLRISWLNGCLTIAALVGSCAVGGVVAALVGGLLSKRRV